MMYQCKYCGRSLSSYGQPFANLHALQSHEGSCRYNPRKLQQDPSRTSLFEAELDDDGKLFAKWLAKVENATHENVQCLLTFHEYCVKVKEAGLKSSDLGFSGNMYVLARYGDTGDYTVDNCRFITQQQNSDEKVISDEYRESKRVQLQEWNAKVSSDPELQKQRIEKFRNSEYCKKLHEQALINRQKYLDSRDMRFSDEHNSQFGSHWITNGVENRKLHPGQEIPEGFHLGRINSNKKTV